MTGANEIDVITNAITKTAISASEGAIRLMLNGSMYMLKVSSKGAKKAVEFFSAVNKSNGGKTSLKKLLDSKAPLDIFTFRENQMPEFIDAAKRYGITFAVVKQDAEDKMNGNYDVMIKKEDAPKLSRVLDKIKYAQVEMTNETSNASIQQNKESKPDARQLINQMLSPVNEINPQMAEEDLNRFSASYNPNRKDSVLKAIDDYKKQNNAKPEAVNQESETLKQLINNMLSKVKDDENERRI